MDRFLILIAAFCGLLVGCQRPGGPQSNLFGYNPQGNGALGNSAFNPAGQGNGGFGLQNPFGNNAYANNGNSNNLPWWQRLQSPSGQQYQATNTNPWWQVGNNNSNNSNAYAQNAGYSQGGPNPSTTPTPQQLQEMANLNRQVQDLNQRLGRFDSVNNGMETEIATMQQKLQVATDLNYQLRQQLADSAVQLQQLQLAKQQSEQRVAAAENQIRQVTANANQAIAQANQQVQNGTQIPTQTAGAPTIRANNSLIAKLPNLQIGGVHSRIDGDVIRVEIPSDPLFVPGSFQIQQSHQNMLGQIAQAIRQHFPRQVVGIESHWDSTPIQPATTTHHQLTATQSLAVFEFLKQVGVPERQMFIMALGSNRPKYASASGQDRRIDIVIYPETID